MNDYRMSGEFSYQGRAALMLIFVALLAACSSTPMLQETSAPLVATATLMAPMDLDTSTPDFAIHPPLTPTARVFNKQEECGSANVNGHIYFLRVNSSGKRNHSSYYDLYVMDGNGCYPRYIMPEASGSPAWSVDGKRLAIGCENNTSLCILDTRATLDSCVGPEDGIGQCQPVVLQKFRLPSAIGEDNRMYNISWSWDGSQIAVEGGSATTPERSVYILTLADDGTWEIFMRRLGEFNIALSPKDDQLAFSGLAFVNLKSDKVRGTKGLYPEWSHDGKKISFVTVSLDENKEPYGIASISLDSGNWEWLYEPILRDDKYYFPPHNLVIRDDGRYHRLLSWSPDGMYIAFVSEVGLGAQSHIFRLDIVTGDIVNLTANIMEDEAYYAPAWGP